VFHLCVMLLYRFAVDESEKMELLAASPSTDMCTNGILYRYTVDGHVN